MEKMLRFQIFLQIRNPGGPIDLVHMLKSKLETSRKSPKQQRLQSCYTFAILTEKFLVSDFLFFECFG